MKKFTLGALIVFATVIGGIYVSSLFSPSTQSQVSQSNTSLPSSSSSPAVPEKLTIAEVAKHNKSSDCYLVINNNVYDVTFFIGFHPGGRREITTRCGQEVTGIFAQIHSNRAWDLLVQYKIGSLN